ncbi:sulfatase-like hydrolase/transferase [Seonamhaeicola sp.]|uniref:sulfatase family protein n=1 Tax=Seonamhaeicola sp. TaxID=1912245 RepID=UPI002610D3DE|nr:sulfatase-like hydrolase/transferase [Seonamhaeicola sp.]
MLFVLAAISGHISAQNEKPDSLSESKPNIILIMADDQGWGQTGYYDHPILKTPNLNDMANNGLQFNRFYAGAPVCSPTRASVLTGRSNDRSAVYTHGYALRRQEKTIAQALKNAGYKTAHFGKWHLNGLQGPGVPIFKSDKCSPGAFGFDYWLSTSNYFDINPIMSRNGNFEEIQGESSAIIVNEALQFMEREKNNDQPLFVVIWYGSPHGPWKAEERAKKGFEDLKATHQEHYGELVAMDESVGSLRKGLRNMGIGHNTLVWFNSDNGGLKAFGPETVNGLKGYKGEMYEGGLRVPAIIEWPAMIKKGQITDFPAVTMDIFPTVADIIGLPNSSMVHPIDGTSLKPLFQKDIKSRTKPIPFRMRAEGAWIDNHYKLVIKDIDKSSYELYHLKTDPDESDNLIDRETEIAHNMIKAFSEWHSSVESSVKGNDYAGGLSQPDIGRILWTKSPEYLPYFKAWSKRPEYKKKLKKFNQE